MSQITNTQADIDSHTKQLQAILFLLQENLEGFKGEVDKSYALLKVGEKTDLSRAIEQMLSQPFDSLFKISSDIDRKAKSVINSFVVSFFVNRKDYIHSVYRNYSQNEDLSYSIILKNDCLESRNKVFDFFDKYDLIELSNKYPVYFQFVPIELIDKMRVVEQIEIV